MPQELIPDKQHALGQPCDICDGRGFDYIGRPCRLFVGTKQSSNRDLT